ncbi:hypothetical protein ABKN59_007807 [Abortiporus biennis]
MQLMFRLSTSRQRGPTAVLLSWEMLFHLHEHPHLRALDELPLCSLHWVDVPHHIRVGRGYRTYTATSQYRNVLGKWR